MLGTLDGVVEELARPLWTVWIRARRRDVRQMSTRSLYVGHARSLRVYLQDAHLLLQHLERRARSQARLVLQQRIHETRLAVLQLHIEQLVAPRSPDVRNYGDPSPLLRRCTVSLKKKRTLPALLEALENVPLQPIPGVGNRLLAFNRATRT